MVKLLVDKGADKTIKNYLEETAEEYVIDNPGMDSVFKTSSLQGFSINPDFENSNEFKNFKEEQLNFLNTLTEGEKGLILYYTTNGDRIINQVFRGNVQGTKTPEGAFTPYLAKIKSRIDVKPDYTNQNLVKRNVDFLEKTNIGRIKQRVFGFSKIFEKVPPTKYPLTVYRGLRSKAGLQDHGNEFLSTSYSKEVANRFRGDECCFLNILVKPGVRALFAEPLSAEGSEENEIIIGPPFKIDKQEVSKGVFNVIISPVLRYRNAGRRKTYRKKNKKRKTIKRKSSSR
jgi:hypothetical protein